MENLGEIVIAPRVLEVITGIATSKVDGVYALRNKAMSDSFIKTTKGRGVYLQTDEAGDLIADIYVYLEYGVSVPAVALAIQKAVKTAVFNYAEVEVSTVNIHVVAIVPEKTPKPDMTDLFNEDFLDD